MDTISGYVDVILQSLRDKNELLDELIAFNNKQRELLLAAEVDADEFNDSLEVKAQLIDKLEKLDDGFTSVYDRAKDGLVANKAEYTAQISEMKQLIAQITDKTTTIQAAEARNRKLAEEYFARTKKETGAARRNSAAANSYFTSMRSGGSTSQFFDKHK